MIDPKTTPRYVTVTKGMSGYFAVTMWWNPEDGFWEPWDTGIGRYEKEDDAIDEGKFIAEDEGIPFTYA